MMNNNEANIIITREKGIISLSVVMPVWCKRSAQGNMLVKLPLLGIETIAKDEEDSATAIEEAIQCFFCAAERFGQGIEKELLALGWECIHEETDESISGYTLSGTGNDIDALVNRLLGTGENYVNSHLEIV